MTKRPDKNIVKEKFIWGLTVSEVSVHKQSTPFLGARGEAEHHGRRVWGREAAHMVIRKQRDSILQIQTI